LNGVDTLSASKALRDLRSLKLLAQRGAGASAYYLAGDEMVAREISTGAGENAIQDKARTLDGTIQGKAFRIEDLPQPLRTRVRTASMRQRLDESDARRVIFGLCAWKGMSATELAGVLNKNKDYISQRYIAPMVAEGLLRYTIPEMPKHPEQRYVAGETPEAET
jgi:ATP-dependent DNA helicase RecG